MKVLQICNLFFTSCRNNFPVSEKYPHLCTVPVHFPSRKFVRHAGAVIVAFMSIQKTKPHKEGVPHSLRPARFQSYLDELAALKNKITKLESEIFSMPAFNGSSKEWPKEVEERAVTGDEASGFGLCGYRDLSSREEEVLRHVSEGYTDKEIASRIFVSVNTVKTHLRRIYEKLQVKNRAEAVMKLKS